MKRQVICERLLFGITGSETAFALLYTHLVKEQKLLSLGKLIDLMSKAPAEKFGFDAGQIYAGAKADLAIFELETEYELKEADYLSRGINTPFTGQRVFGQTYLTLVDGRPVYQKEGEK